MACSDDYLAGKERYRSAVNALMQAHQGRKVDEVMPDIERQKLHQVCTGTKAGYDLIWPPYCDDPACQCQQLKWS